MRTSPTIRIPNRPRQRRLAMLAVFPPGAATRGSFTWNVAILSGRRRWWARRASSRAHRPHNGSHVEHAAARPVEWTSRPDPSCADASGWLVRLCIRLVMRREPGVVSDRLVSAAVLGPGGRARRLHETALPQFLGAIAAARPSRPSAEFWGALASLDLAQVRRRRSASRCFT
jgi:hypothetical protein